VANFAVDGVTKYNRTVLYYWQMCKGVHFVMALVHLAVLTCYRNLRIITQISLHVETVFFDQTFQIRSELSSVIDTVFCALSIWY